MNGLSCRIPIAAFLILAPFGHPTSLAAQNALSTITGSVHDAESGRPLSAAIVTVGQRSARTDSLGRFSLSDLPIGQLRLRVRSMGFAAFDTAFMLHDIGAPHLELRLEPMIRDRDVRAAEEKNIAAGRIDSSALGLLHRPPADSSLTFGVFGERLLRTITRERGVDSNTVLSPTSAAFALSIALIGARGATADEITATLGVNGLARATLQRRTASAMVAGTGRSDVSLEIANAVWADTALRLASSFVEGAASYHAVTRALPLAAQSTVGAINAWADSVTHGRITEVLRDKLPDTTRLFIANAVYFKGKWLDEFEKTETRRRDFRLASGKTVQVDGMERTGMVGYRREKDYQMVRLPYRGGRFAMYVILPDSGARLASIDQNFAAQGWPPSLVAKDFRDVHVVIPRLHVTGSYDLGSALRTLGIRRAFDCDIAEFQGIGTQQAPLCIGKATQTVYLDVDEEGTEAAAITGLVMVMTNGVEPPPIEFIVDRPFMFLLRDEQTGVDLFAGTIHRP